MVIAIRSQKLWATLSLSFGSVTDIVTASALTYYLSKMRTGYQKSDNIVLRLTAYAVSTGFLTSAASLATLILVSCRDKEHPNYLAQRTSAILVQQHARQLHLHGRILCR